MEDKSPTLHELLKEFSELKKWQRQQGERLLEEQQRQRDLLSFQQKKMRDMLQQRGTEAEDLMENKDDGNNTSDDIESDLEGIQSLPETENEESDAAEENNDHLTHDEDVKVIDVSEKNTVENDEHNEDQGESDEIIVVFEKRRTDVPPIDSERKNLPLTPEKSIDELPISTCTKPFHDFLEDKLDDIEKEVTPKETFKRVKPKQPFLRKGHGLARYKMGPFASLSTKTKSKEELKKSSMPAPAAPRVPLARFSGKVAPVLCAGSNKASKTSLGTKERRTFLKRKVCPQKPAISQGHVEVAKKETTGAGDNEKWKREVVINEAKAFMKEKLEEVDNKFQKEQAELAVFEYLEDAADNSSFCSSSSTMLRLLDVSESPNRAKEVLSLANSQQVKTNDTYRDIFSNSNKVYRLAEESDEDEEEERSLHVHFSDKVPEKHEYTAYLDESTEHFSDEEPWPTTHDSDENTLVEDSEGNLEKPKPVKMENKLISVVLDSSLYVPLCNQEKDQSKNKLLSADRKNGNASDHSEGDKVDLSLEKNGGGSQELQFKTALLHARVVELEQEIETFKKENAQVTQLRQMQEKLAQELKEEMAEFRKHKEQEMLKVERYLENEKGKLRKERMAFERRIKEAREQPNRKEREEIQQLREEIDKMREEVTKKESRWTAAQVRVKDRMKELEEENVNLKEEVLSLRKKNASGPLMSRSTSCSSLSKATFNSAPRKEVKSTWSKQNIIDIHPTKEIPVELLASNSTAEVTNKLSLKQETANRNQDIHTVLSTAFYEYEGDSSKTKPANEQSSQTGNSSNTSPRFPDSLEVSESSLNQGISPREVILPHGKEIHYPNGNIKSLSKDGESYNIKYYNGDIKETLKDGTVKYFYHKTQAWNTTYPDGLNVIEFPDGQIERQLLDGTVEVSYPNGSVMLIHSDGSKENHFTDGVVVREDRAGNTTMIMPNGQREIHTLEYKCREYPDGTVKTVYVADGRQETRYACGRVRIKDAKGNLIMDTGTS